MLQEAGHVQSEVHRPGEVVWVCVHPANYLESKRNKKREKELNMDSSCADPLKTSKPSKLKLIVSSRPQLPFVRLSEAT